MAYSWPLPSILLFCTVTLSAEMVRVPVIALPLMTVPAVLTVIGPLLVKLVPVAGPVLVPSGMVPGSAGEDEQKSVEPPLPLPNFTAWLPEAVESTTLLAAGLMVPFSA